jgi:hypothetical protein
VKKIVFTISLFFSANAFAADYVSQEVMTILQKYTTKWAKDGVIPSHENGHKGYKELFDELKSKGVIPENARYVYHYFGRNNKFTSGSPNLSIKGDGRWFTYEFISKDGIYTVDKILDEGDRSKFTRRQLLYDASEDNAFVRARIRRLERLAADCKMGTFNIEKIIEIHSNKWRTSQVFPSHENGHSGYDVLFNDLKKAGVFKAETQYSHLIFGRSYDYGAKTPL